MAFAPKLGCPMCGIVAAATRPQPLPTTNTSQVQVGSTDILFKDDNFTIYRETAHPVSSQGHIVIVFNLHVPSFYVLSSTDVPMLVDLNSIARRVLLTIHAAGTSQSSPMNSASSQVPVNVPSLDSQIRVGFITPPFKDNRIPITDHLHAHAYIAPNDLCGWWRGISYGSLGWYAIEDLIAEIRESTSNNRVKSGYESRRNAPIDRIPDAGARFGTPSGQETTTSGLVFPSEDAAASPPTASSSNR